MAIDGGLARRRGATALTCCQNREVVKSITAQTIRISESGLSWVTLPRGFAASVTNGEYSASAFFEEESE